MAVTAEIPAHANGVVDTERLLVRTRIEGPKALIERAEGSHSVVGDAKFEMFWQSDSEAHGALPSERLHGIGVVDLGNRFAEKETWFEEEVGVTKRGAREGLKFNVSRGDVARKRRAGRLRLIAAAEIRLVVRRREFEIAIAAQEAFTEKQRSGIGVL